MLKLFQFFIAAFITCFVLSTNVSADTETELEQARQQISELKARLNVYELAGIPDEAEHFNTEALNPSVTNQSSDNVAYEQLQRQHQSARLRVGELQAELTELRKNISDTRNDKRLLEENETLKLEKRKLLRKLDELGVLVDLEEEPELLTNSVRNIIYAAIFCVITGILIGMYIFDYRNRRKHGGFRL